LYVQQGRLDLAERELRRGEFTFPSHPYVLNGRIRLSLAHRAYAEALRLAATAAETPETAAIRGDLLAALGDAAGAETAYQDADRLEREGWEYEEPQPAALARLLAERGRNASEAVSLAERAARDRADIHTMDTLAWAYFRAGRVDAAAAAMRKALRTGTRDPRIRCHASAIAAAQAGSTPASCHPLDVAAVNASR
jgi:tetratricopeptide (TPR) repeat protein